MTDLVMPRVPAAEQRVRLAGRTSGGPSRVPVLILSVVHPDYLPSLYSLSAVLEHEGYEPHIFCFESAAAESDLWQTVRLHLCGAQQGGPARRWHARRSLLRGATQWADANLPVAVIATCPFTFLGARRIARGRVLIYLSYETYAVTALDAIRSPLSWWRSHRSWRSLRRADLVCAPSPERAGWLAARASLDRIPATVLNSPSRRVWPRADRAAALARELLPPHLRGRAALIHTGRVSHAQGILELVQSVQYWPGNAALIITNVGHSAYEREVRRAALESPRAGDIVLLPAVPRSALLALQASASVGVFLARETTALETRMPAPNKVGEYVHAGLVVVATRSTYMERLEQHGAAVLTETLAPRAIADAAAEAVARSALPTTRTALRDVADSWYNMESQARPILRVLDERRAGCADGGHDLSPT